MKGRKSVFSLVGALLGMLCLILDSASASRSAADALELCLRTVIPCLFPMLVLSAWVTSGLSGTKSAVFRGLEGFLGLPMGGGGLFLLGSVGGFPVGAQSLAQLVRAGRISPGGAGKLLGFCNNCGPAFLFGMLGCLFSEPWTPVWIFLIQLETAAVTARMFASGEGFSTIAVENPVTLTEAVGRGVRSMTVICAWVVLAGVVNGFLIRWLFPLLPDTAGRILCGVLELTGGVLGLAAVPREGLRMILCAGFVCFGGICVLLQVQAVAGEAGIPMGDYFRQKVFQGLLGAVLAAGVVKIGLWVLLLLPGALIFWKIAVEIPGRTMYNRLGKGG